MPRSYLDLRSGLLVKLLHLKWQGKGQIQLSRVLIIMMTEDKIMNEIRSECKLMWNAETISRRDENKSVIYRVNRFSNTNAKHYLFPDCH